MIGAMTPKLAPKPKLTAAERHARFVKMAMEVEASERPEDFDKAFKRVAPTVPRSRDGA
jgi:hypothetical protein